MVPQPEDSENTNDYKADISTDTLETVCKNKNKCARTRYSKIVSFNVFFLQCQRSECLGSSNDTTMSTPLKPQAVAKSKPQAATPPVIIISDEEVKDIPDPFPFPVTYSANVDAALHRGKKLKFIYCMLQ